MKNDSDSPSEASVETEESVTPVLGVKNPNPEMFERVGSCDGMSTSHGKSKLP